MTLTKLRSKSFLLLCCILISFQFPLLTTQGQSSEVIDRDLTPILSYDQEFQYSIELTQEWTAFELEEINTGSSSYHVITLQVTDNLTSSFDISEYYKIKFDFDLLGTVLDPEPYEVVLEDDQVTQEPFSFDIESTDIIDFNPSVITLSESAVILTVNLRVQTFVISTYQYDFESESYAITTLPSNTYFITTGSFAWVYHPETYLFFDNNLVDELAGNEIEIIITLGIDAMVEDNDKIRLEALGSDDSTNVGAPVDLVLKFELEQMISMEVSTLSEYLEFTITKVSINIDPETLSGFIGFPEIPMFGWIPGVILYFVSFMVVYKYSMRINLEKIEKGVEF